MNNALLEHVVCNLCVTDKPIVIYPSKRNSAISIKDNEFRSSGDEPLIDPLVKCSNCGLKYVTPRVNSKLVLDSYINAVDETYVSQSKGREKTFKRCLSIIQDIWKKVPCKILDVGTANGSFLKVARDAGWDVAGCEPNRWMCRWCETNYGIQITPCTIFDANYENQTFDIVTLWDVLEHTADPIATLRECARVLRPGGLLVVNYPDIGSWIARLMGRKWVFLLSVHYYYFTRQTIKNALEQVGLEVIKSKPHFQTLELDYIMLRAIPYIGITGKIFRSIIKGIRLEKLNVPYWMGQTIVIAKKNGKGI